MRRSGPLRLLPLLIIIVILTGCAYPISNPLRAQARRDLSIPQVIANPSAYRHALVIWGGAILSVENQDGRSTLLVKEYPLDWRGEPNIFRESDGRFLLHTSRYLDPAVYRKGRYITMAGEITGVKTEKSGKAEYRYPELSAREIHLWRDYPVVYYDYPPPAWDWGWGWGPPYYGWHHDYYYHSPPYYRHYW